jgi:transcription termination factor NusB
MEKTDSYIVFNERPMPLYPSYRPMYKVSLILLVLSLNGYAGKASLLKLHLFSWALKSHKNLDALKEFVVSNYKKDLKFFGIELTLNRALNLAIAENLISFVDDKYSLLEKGIEFANYLIKSKELFIYEKQVLKMVGKRITDDKMNELLKHWKNA